MKADGRKHLPPHEAVRYRADDGIVAQDVCRGGSSQRARADAGPGGEIDEHYCENHRRQPLARLALITRHADVTIVAKKPG